MQRRRLPSPSRAAPEEEGEGGSGMGCEVILLERPKPRVYLTQPITPETLRRMFTEYNQQSRRGIKTTPQLLEALSEYINQFRMLPSRILTRREAAEKAGVSRSALRHYLRLLKMLGLNLNRTDRGNPLYCFQYANVCLRCRMKYPKDVHICPLCGRPTRKKPRHMKYRRRYTALAGEVVT